jgi:DNA-binding beta-propeller fold protein YncE
MRKQALTASTLAVALAVVLLAPAPSLAKKSPQEKWEEVKQELRQRIVYPPPPDTPRIRWVDLIRGNGDIRPPRKKSIWKRLAGAPEEGERDFWSPLGIAVDSRGRIYVADTKQNMVFVLDKQQGKVHEFWGQGAYLLQKPAYVDIDADDRAYVSDSQGGKVVQFEPDGTPVKVYGVGKLGKPLGVAVDGKRRRLYVADAEKNRVAVFGTESGELIESIGTQGTGPGEFNTPYTVAVDKRGFLYVVDYFNYRVQVFNRRGQFVFTFGTRGEAPGQFFRPKGIAVDSKGHIYVADTMFANIQIFDQQGRPLMFFGGHGTIPGSFTLLTDIFIDDQDRIYTTERYVVRVQVFQYLDQPESVQEGEEVAQSNGN